MIDCPYILLCAGEDSGDSIGESLVKNVIADGRFAVVGAGGARMQKAGLEPLVEFENLPVSGFGDVLPKYFKLRESFGKLKTALESPNCKGLVAIDYPGFNMKLVRLAGKLEKPCLYGAPPQVWAWKAKRAQELAQNPFVKLAVFFDFEEAVYKEAGCDVVRVNHPFKEVVANSAGAKQSVFASKILLLPGSRKSQALRNLPLYLKAVKDVSNVVVVAARQELVPAFEKFGVQVLVAPTNAQDRAALYRSARFAITAPGTATLELALSGCPMVVCTKPDLLTYCLGRLFIKTKYFALPNIILNRLGFPERIVAPWTSSGELNQWIASVESLPCDDLSAELREKIAAEKSLDSLMTEFLRKLV
jgi:lipid-A-disaccharide synthase